MQEKHLFEYAVIRAVPRVEREEFVNVGVIVYCSGLRFLQMQYAGSEAKIKALCPDADVAEFEKRLVAFKKICDGVKACSPISALPIASRFRWLTASRSTILQTSKVHPGLCIDANKTLQKLFADIVA